MKNAEAKIVVIDILVSRINIDRAIHYFQNKNVSVL